MNQFERRADQLWSRYIRTRDGRCLMADESCWGELHAHHLFRRTFKATRWDEHNGVSLCALHHEHLHRHPLSAADWRLDLLGSGGFARMLGKAQHGEIPDVKEVIVDLERRLREGVEA